MNIYTLAPVNTLARIVTSQAGVTDSFTKTLGEQYNQLEILKREYQELNFQFTERKGPRNDEIKLRRKQIRHQILAITDEIIKLECLHSITHSGEMNDLQKKQKREKRKMKKKIKRPLEWWK